MTIDWSPLDAVAERMDRRLAEFQEAGDHRSIFLTVYRAMTAQMQRFLPAGRFLDPQWTLALTTRFAGMYFEADEAFSHPDQVCPGPWQCAFAAASVRRVLTLEHALLGINAHITYDLPRAVADNLVEFSDLVPGTHGMPVSGVLVRRRYDYEVVNDILAHTTDMVQDALVQTFSPFLKVLDTLAMRFDEYAAEMFLRYARTQGWTHAVALGFARDDHERELIRAQLEHVSMEQVARIDLTSNLPRRLRKVAYRMRPPLRLELTSG